MTVQELNTRFDGIIKDLQGESLGNIMAGIGLTARKMIYERVHDTGVDSKGQKYKDYSVNPMLVGDKSFRKKDSQKFFNRKDLDWKSIRKPGVAKPQKGKHNKKDDYWRLAVLEGGYKELREISGRQADHVDFSFTGMMWNDITLKSKASDHSRGIAIIGALKEEEKKKLEGNTAKRGDILMLSGDELKGLSTEFSNHIERIVKNNGL